MDTDIAIDPINHLIVSFPYRNEDDEVRDELDSHIGFCRLRFDKERKSISGTYFTNREIQTKGNISAKNVYSPIKGKY